jgi:hypothetical protein
MSNLDRCALWLALAGVLSIRATLPIGFPGVPSLLAAAAALIYLFRFFKDRA